MCPDTRVQLRQAFVLHRRPYRETSLLLEVFTRDFGRLGLVARGVRRRASRLAGVLQPFRPLLLSWSGRRELGTLADAEYDGVTQPLGGPALASGFYVNELVLRLLHRFDPHPELFGIYAGTLERLRRSGAQESALRIFEKRLLEAVGYGLVLDHDVVSGRPLEPDAVYDYRHDRGPVPAGAGGTEGIRMGGDALAALARERLDTPEHLLAAKRLMRYVLRVHLGDRPVTSRTLFRGRE